MDTVSYRPRAREIPTQPGVYRFRDSAGRVLYVGKAKNLRARLSNYFAPLRDSARAHQTDGHHRELRRVDRGQHGVRGAPTRVHLDQGIQPAVQCAVPRRQDLPVPRDHHGRRRAAGVHHPQPQDQGRTLLRPVHEGVGDPGNPRPDAQGVPDAQLLGCDLPPGAANRPAVPARGHRSLLRTLRRTHQQGRPQGDRPGLRVVHGGKRLAVHPHRHRPDEAGRRRPGI